MVYTSSTYALEISDDLDAPEWDAFLAQTAGGHHLQSSLWGRLRTSVGWQAVRILLRDEGQIVAGAQLLLRPLVAGFKLAYLPKGPLLGRDDPELGERMTTAVLSLIKQQKIITLILQPPDNDTFFTANLATHGFAPSPLPLSTNATVKVDLTQEREAILAGMKSKTRYNARLGKRKGITVRQGTRDDLPLFYKLLNETGERQEFSPYSLDYFETMWDILAPPGYLHLFFACYEGEALSANLSITFGDTVLYKRGAWSGQHGDLRPNEVMHWEVIEWAKTHGFHYYDFEGIEMEAARCTLAGEPLPESLHRSTSRFKLGFCNEALILPAAQIYAPSRLLRWGYGTVLPWLNGRFPLKRLVNLIRARTA